MPPMQQNSFSYDDLISCAKGDMFGPGNPQLPMPPMLMCDRITDISMMVGRMARDISFRNSTSSLTCGSSPAISKVIR